MGIDRGRRRTRRRRRRQPDRQHPSQEGWRQYIDAHPELAEQGFAIRTAVDVSCSQKKVCLRARRTRQRARSRRPPRMTAAEIQRPPRLPRARQGHREDVDGHRGRRPSRRRRGRLPGPAERHQPQRRRRRQGELRPPRHAGRRPTGIPTVVFPAGYNDHGQPINIQLLGRAWDDDKLVGMAYAFEQLATKDGKGHVAPSTAPALKVVTETGGTVGGTVPATLSLTLGARPRSARSRRAWRRTTPPRRPRT